jgi:UDP-N-acetyl-D-galactosamine dehydrogenase
MKKIGIIGLGYVGLGLATELSKHFPVVGYDIAGERIKELQQNIDTNELISEEELRSCKLLYSSEIEDIKDSNFYIVTVSTPAYFYEMPNLAPLISATKNLALFLKKGDIVVYESTVYPGTTEEICLPLLEEISQLKAGVDFNIGYSPERISPGDQEHSLQNITKIISAQNEHTLNEVSTIYKTICESVYPVSSIQTAEAVKILENTQRDTNIALMNEFSQIMHAIDLDVHEIIEAAKTKWSFVPFKPGFVGGIASLSILST